MLAIRLRRVGAKKRPVYRIVVTESTSPREGRFVEVVGSYHPCTQPEQLTLNREKFDHWVRVGARPSDSVRTLVARHKPVAVEAAAQ